MSLRGDATCRRRRGTVRSRERSARADAEIRDARQQLADHVANRTRDGRVGRSLPHAAFQHAGELPEPLLRGAGLQMPGETGRGSARTQVPANLREDPRELRHAAATAETLSGRGAERVPDRRELAGDALVAEADGCDPGDASARRIAELRAVAGVPVVAEERRAREALAA